MFIINLDVMQNKWQMPSTYDRFCNIPPYTILISIQATDIAGQAIVNYAYFSQTQNKIIHTQEFFTQPTPDGLIGIRHTVLTESIQNGFVVGFGDGSNTNNLFNEPRLSNIAPILNELMKIIPTLFIAKEVFTDAFLVATRLGNIIYVLVTPALVITSSIIFSDAVADGLSILENGRLITLDNWFQRVFDNAVVFSALNNLLTQANKIKFNQPCKPIAFGYNGLIWLSVLATTATLGIFAASRAGNGEKNDNNNIHNDPNPLTNNNGYFYENNHTYRSQDKNTLSSSKNISFQTKKRSLEEKNKKKKMQLLYPTFSSPFSIE